MLSGQDPPRGEIDREVVARISSEGLELISKMMEPEENKRILLGGLLFRDIVLFFGCMICTCSTSLLLIFVVKIIKKLLIVSI